VILDYIAVDSKMESHGHSLVNQNSELLTAVDTVAIGIALNQSARSLKRVNILMNLHAPTFASLPLGQSAITQLRSANLVPSVLKDASTLLIPVILFALNLCHTPSVIMIPRSVLLAIKDLIRTAPPLKLIALTSAPRTMDYAILTLASAQAATQLPLRDAF
jgi:hypothetical protein